MTRKEQIQFILWSMIVIVLSIVCALIALHFMEDTKFDLVYHPQEAHQEQASWLWLVYGFFGIAVYKTIDLVSFLTHKHFKAL